eukprot:2599463-Alexandrium_andersonii.AAC.1
MVGSRVAGRDTSQYRRRGTAAQRLARGPAVRARCYRGAGSRRRLGVVRRALARSSPRHFSVAPRA